MRICHCNSGQAGGVVGDKVYPPGESLVKAGHLRIGEVELHVQAGR